VAVLAVTALSAFGCSKTQPPSAATTPPSAPSSNSQLKEVIFPVLPQSGADVNAFVPAGWLLDAKTTGDLNGDGKPDLLFVLINKAPGLGIKGVAVLPRIIAVALANADRSGYTLALQNSTLLTLEVESLAEDMMDGHDSCYETPAPAKCDFILSIAHGAFQVYIQNSRGGAGGETFTFRFQHRGVELIGYTDTGVLGDTIETADINYSTGRMVSTKEKMSSSGPGKSTTKILPKKPLPNIQTMGNVRDFLGPNI
jgi:hypothetical protein